MVDSAELIRKVRFPRQLVAFSMVATQAVTFGLMLVILFVLSLLFVPEARTTVWAAIPLAFVFGGLVAGITLVIPYVVPFYLMLALLEDSGILTRVAFMVDSGMHRMGLHGKAVIPFILGYGCNVPAIYSTRVLETRRERLRAPSITNWRFPPWSKRSRSLCRRYASLGRPLRGPSCREGRPRR
jgi:Fe2+ transport system protein B